MEVEVPMT